MPNQNTPTHSFTLKSTKLERVIPLPIEIFNVNDKSIGFKTTGIWDTGATSSVITQEIADFLGVKQSGMTTVNTASVTGLSRETYLVDVYLKKDLCIQAVEVTIGTIDHANGFDCLIGMDIITLGDLSITNYEGKTCMSFRIPSKHEIDYNKNPHLKVSDKVPTGGNNITPPHKKRKRR
jgi:predicted aspartyl protease